MRITPEECAELSDRLPLRLVIYDTPDNKNKVLTVFDHGKFTYGRRLLHKDAKAIVALPAILDLVAEQQKRIDELEAHVERLRGAVGYAIKDTYPTEKYLWAISDDCCDTLEKVYGETPAQCLAHIKREALEMAAKICAAHPIPKCYTEENGGDGGYNDALSDCADAIRKEMEVREK